MSQQAFGAYAKYYDDMYRNKEYGKETDLIESVFRSFSGHSVKKILSLGCGTGTYEIELAKRGYTITGVDISADMLAEAKKKISVAGVADKITLIQSDIRDLKGVLGEFDAAIMMFNIAGYLRTLSDMTAVAHSVATRIPEGGIFLFDAWYAPAVVADPPNDRTKVVEKNGSKITRSTKGSLDEVKRLVKITFHVTEEKSGETKNEVTENHPMRYWDIGELKESLESGGLALVKTTSINNLDEPESVGAWDMNVVAKKM